MLLEARDWLQARKRMKSTSREERSGPEQGAPALVSHSKNRALERTAGLFLLADLSDLNLVG